MNKFKCYNRGGNIRIFLAEVEMICFGTPTSGDQAGGTGDSAPPEMAQAMSTEPMLEVRSAKKIAKGTLIFLENGRGQQIPAEVRSCEAGEGNWTLAIKGGPSDLTPQFIG